MIVHTAPVVVTIGALLTLVITGRRHPNPSRLRRVLIAFMVVALSVGAGVVVEAMSHKPWITFPNCPAEDDCGPY